MSPEIKKKSEQTLTLGEVVTYFRRQWLLLLAVWFAVVAIVVIYTCLARPSFLSSTTLYFETDQANTSQLASMVSAFGSKSNIETDKELLQSIALIDPLIRRYGLNVTITGDETYLPQNPSFFSWWLNQDIKRFKSGLRVEHLVYGTPPTSKQEFQLRFHNDHHFSLHPLVNDEYAKQGQVTSRIGESVSFENLGFVVTYHGKDVPAGTVFNVEIVPPQSIHTQTLEKLRIEGGGVPPMRKNLLRVSFQAESPQLAQAMAAGISKGYLDMRQDWATSSSQTVIAFIEKNLDDLEKQLDESSSELSSFQERSGLLAIEPQLSAQIQKLIEAEQEVQRTDIRLIQLEQLQNALDSNTPEPSLLAFLDDPVVRQLSERLTLLNEQIAEMSTRYQADAVPLQNKYQTRQNILDSLDEIVDEYVRRAKEVKQHAEQISADYRKSLNEMPLAAQALAEYERSQHLVEELYTLLIREKQRAKLAEASTMSDIRIVDPPSLPLEEFSPQAKRNGVIGLGLGLFLAFCVVFIRMLTVRTIQTVEDLTHTFPEIPIYAYLPRTSRKKFPRASPKVLEAAGNSPYMENIRQLRVNLMNTRAGKQSQVIMFTSSMPSDGKSTVLANLAASMTQTEKIDRGILVIDGDIPKPSLDGIFDQLRSPGLTDYLNGEANIDEIIRPVMLPNRRQLDLICSGPVSPSPVELLESNRLRQLFDFARSKYSFVLIDSAPYPLHTSPLVVAPHVDRLLVVARVQHTRTAILNRCTQDLLDVNKHLGLVVNGIDKGSSYGSYGGSYSYQKTGGQ